MHTDRPLDVTVAGAGSFAARDAAGHEVRLRSASLEQNARGELVDGRGRVVIGTDGPIVAGADAEIDARGVVREAGRVVG